MKYFWEFFDIFSRPTSRKFLLSKIHLDVILNWFPLKLCYYNMLFIKSITPVRMQIKDQSLRPLRAKGRYYFYKFFQIFLPTPAPPSTTSIKFNLLPFKNSRNPSRIKIKNHSLRHLLVKGCKYLLEFFWFFTPTFTPPGEAYMQRLFLEFDAFKNLQLL